MPESRKRQPKSRPARPATPGRTTAAPGKELRPVQLVAFIVVGLLVAGAFVGVGFVVKSQRAYGQWPWARTPIPPKMYFDKRNFKDANAAPLPATRFEVGKTPGGGIIYATTKVKSPVPTVIWVQDPKTHAVTQFALSGGP